MVNINFKELIAKPEQSDRTFLIINSKQLNPLKYYF